VEKYFSTSDFLGDAGLFMLTGFGGNQAPLGVNCSQRIRNM